MERHRWLWAVGTALGLQLTIMPSTIAHISFLRQSPWLDTLDAALSQAFLNDAMMAQALNSEQRQTNTVTIDRTDLDAPHQLTIATSANLAGEIVINGEAIAPLTAGTTTLNIAPYLTANRTTTITVTGTYAPRNAAIRLTFEGPSIAISQQASGVGRLDYRLNLDVN